MTIDIQLIEPHFSDEFVQNFIELNELIFVGDQFAEGIKWRMNNMPRTSIFIAKELMIEQHHWLKVQGFSEVETHLSQNNTAMINLNQKCGMQITGLYMNDEKPYFIMRKKIEK